MKLIDASYGVFKNFNHTKDVKSLSEVLETVPVANSKIIKMFDVNPMLFFTESMGKVFDAKPLMVDKMKYKWSIEYSPNYRTTIAVSAPTDYNLGRNGQEFTICLKEEIANKNDLLVLENEQQLYVRENSSRGDGYYSYKVVLLGNDPDRAVDFESLQVGKYISNNGNVQPELSRVGYSSYRMNKEERINYMTKIRVGDEWTGDAAINEKMFYMCDMSKDGKKIDKVLGWMTGFEKLYLQELYAKKEFAIFRGQCNVSKTGNDKVFTQTSSGEDVMTGDGVYEQIKKDGITRTYTRFSENLLKEMVSNIQRARPTKPVGGTKVVLMTGFDGYVQFDSAMRSILGIGAIGNIQHPSLLTSPNSTTNVGIKFGTYNYLGVEFTLVQHPYFDDTNFVATRIDPNTLRSEWSSKYIAMDMSTYDGVANICSLQRDGLTLIKGETNGFGGRNGKTSGVNSTRVHGSSVDYVTYTGAVVHVPETCMILEKSRVL